MCLPLELPPRDAISDTPTLDEQLRKREEAWPPRSPLDEEARTF